MNRHEASAMARDGGEDRPGLRRRAAAFVCRPRLRFREFLLLITMASLIAAALAMRVRTTRDLSALDHGFQAARARVSAKWWGERTGWLKDKLESRPPISEAWLAGCELRLTSADDVPTTGENLIIVSDGILAFRIFDGDGKIVVEHSEGGRRGDDCLKGLAGLWPPHELTAAERRRIVAEVASILQAYRTYLQAEVRNAEAMQADEIAKAEFYKEIARQP